MADEQDFLKKSIKIILENDFRVERYYGGKEGTHVTYFHEVRKVSNDAVLGEAVFTNTLLVD